jgi:hypothetical protein
MPEASENRLREIPDEPEPTGVRGTWRLYAVAGS